MNGTNVSAVDPILSVLAELTRPSDGTCISTLEPQCILGFNSHKRNDIIIYIKRTISLFETLRTYDFLKHKG